MEQDKIGKKNSKNKKVLIALGIAAAAIAVSYLLLCTYAFHRERILPNVSVSGINVSEMSLAQAQSTIQTALADHAQRVSVISQYESWEAPLFGDELDIDPAENAQNALRVGHENFFSSGFQLLGHMLGMSTQCDLAISPNDPVIVSATEELSREIQKKQSPTTYTLEEDRLVMTKGVSSVDVDWDQVRTDIALKFQDAFTEAFEQGVSDQKEVIIRSQGESLPEPDFDAIYDQVAIEPVEAQLDPETFQISDHAAGRDMHLQALKTAYENAREGQTFSVPVYTVEPEKTKQSLEQELFSDLLGEGRSLISGTWGRRYNVKLSGAACNGIVLMPGDIFSYNDATGSRTAARGYQSATVYSGGLTVEEVGGGVCQTSSTIYYALLHSTLEVVTRRAHGFTVDYLPAGMDATSYYGLTDFQFRNNTDFPVKISTSVENEGSKEYLVVRLWGTNKEGTYAVPRSNVYNTVYPTTVYQPKEDVPRGTTVVDTEQYPYTGLSAHTYRDIFDRDGNLLETEDMGISVYRMRPRTIFYNPADGDPSTWVDGKPPETPVESETPTQPENPTESETPVESETFTQPENPTESGNPAETENSTPTEAPVQTDSPSESEPAAEPEESSPPIDLAPRI